MKNITIAGMAISAIATEVEGFEAALDLLH
jgi:hypothetical protein